MLDVIDAAIDVVPGGDGEIAATQLHEVIRIRRALWHPAVRGNHGVHVADVMAGGEGDVAATERADVLEEIAVVNPPGG